MVVQVQDVREAFDDQEGVVVALQDVPEALDHESEEEEQVSGAPHCPR